jgi:hypothetical protein
MHEKIIKGNRRGGGFDSEKKMKNIDHAIDLPVSRYILLHRFFRQKAFSGVSWGNFFCVVDLFLFSAGDAVMSGLGSSGYSQTLW